MISSASLRTQIEAALSHRIPSALTPPPRTIRAVESTGIANVDGLLNGGMPVGAITEISGSECTGRTSLALSFIAQLTHARNVCAWVDVSNTFHPESAAGAGVDLTRLLWVRCGIPQQRSQLLSSQNHFALEDKYFISAAPTKGLHGGGFGLNPRGESKGLSAAVGDVLHMGTPHSQCVRNATPDSKTSLPLAGPLQVNKDKKRKHFTRKPWSRLDQALRVTDLLLQGGGFRAIVLDMGSVLVEHALRVPLATWFRYRAAAERTQASILLLTQHSCAKSSAGLVLHLQTGDPIQREATVFTGMKYRVDVVRERHVQSNANVILLRKPPQRESTSDWTCRSMWAGRQ